MSKTPMVSIIVPVYNASKTLRRCVDSVLKQEYADFELFLVDDGSQDDSGTICDEYAGKDPRVRVIHKANAGVSAARNDALDQARGEYLQFLDSDDWLSPDATRLLVRTAQETQCDLVIADFYRVSGERVSHKGEIDEEGVMSRETFAALRAPIYYYVKTKGSLVSQSMNLPNVIRMKLRVFEYYNDFYKHVLDERDYEKNRLKVYRFLVDAAGDESLLPSLKKLGDERPTVCARAVSAQGAAADAYRSRKLLEHYLEPAAQKHDLTGVEVRVLLCLWCAGEMNSRKELADFAGVNRVGLILPLQKLALRGLIQAEGSVEGEDDSGKGKRLRVSLLPAAQPILDDIAQGLEDYDQARFAGFSREELERYSDLSGKIQENMRRVLQ